MKIPIFALPHRVTIISFKGSGAYGPIWESDPAKHQKNIPCRIERKSRLVKSANGEDVVQTAQGIFHPDYPINQGDKIVWEKYGLEYQVAEWFPVDAMGHHSNEAVLM